MQDGGRVAVHVGMSREQADRAVAQLFIMWPGINTIAQFGVTEVAIVGIEGDVVQEHFEDLYEGDLSR